MVRIPKVNLALPFCMMLVIGFLLFVCHKQEQAIETQRWAIQQQEKNIQVKDALIDELMSMDCESSESPRTKQNETYLSRK